MATIKELEKQIEEMRAQLAMLTGTPSGRVVPLPPEERADFIAYGSEQHMVFLGIREATEDDEVTYASDSGQKYALTDITVFGVNVRPEFLKAILMQKVSSFTCPVPVLQSTDPAQPHYAPPLWIPDDIPVTGIV